MHTETEQKLRTALRESNDALGRWIELEEPIRLLKKKLLRELLDLQLGNTGGTK
jgi:hypothetical protein